MDKNGGFLASLFDFSFTAFVTPKIIKLLFGLSIAGAAIFAVSLIATAFVGSIFSGILTLFIVAPIVFLIMVIYARVFLETIIVFFRIAEHTAQLAAQGRPITTQTGGGQEDSA